MEPRTPAWKWVLGLAVLALGAWVSRALYVYADADDAPGGMVIAVLLFAAAAGVASWIVYQRPQRS